MGWEETREALDELEDDPDFEPGIVQLDPAEHEQRFRELGLVVCPSIVYRDEIIAVGPPNADSIKTIVKELG